MESVTVIDAGICKKKEFSAPVTDDVTIQRFDQNRLTRQDNYSMKAQDVSEELNTVLCITDSSLSCEDSDTNESGNATHDYPDMGLVCSKDNKDPQPKDEIKIEVTYQLISEDKDGKNDDSGSSNSFASIPSLVSNERNNLRRKEFEFHPPSEMLATKIMIQAEEVFSDFNILKDNFLQKHIRRSKEGYISVKFVASFRKIKSLTKDWRDVKYSIQNSQKLMLNENGTKVRRIDPIPEFEDTIFAKTVVIFNLPNDKTDDVQNILSPFGEIRKITLVQQGSKPPEICTTRFLIYFKQYVKNKTFAVAEFVNYDSAVKSVSALRNEQDVEDKVKVVPLISDDYRNQSKPSSRRGTSSSKSKGSIGYSSYDRKYNRRLRRPSEIKHVPSARRNKYSASDADNNTDSSNSTGSFGKKTRNRRGEAEDIEFVPPSDELAQKIMKQAEEWFSDFSLFKTSFLLNHIRRSKEGYISVKLVSSSRKIRALTKDWRAVQYSIRMSEKLSLNERGTKVRRIAPIANFEDTIYAKTVAVFNIPSSDINCDNMCQYMSSYGEVVRVTIISSKTDIPEICTKRFLTIHENFIQDKPFALVEYEDYNSAIQATSNTEDNSGELKVVPIMSDAYKLQSNPSSHKRDSKSSKTNNSSNDSRQSRRKGRNVSKRKPYGRRKTSTDNERQQKTSDEDCNVVRRVSNKKKLSSSSPIKRNSKQRSNLSYRTSAQNRGPHMRDRKANNYDDNSYYGKEITSTPRGITSSPQRRNHSNKSKRQSSSPSGMKSFRFPGSTSSYSNSYPSCSNIMGPYWENNLGGMRDSRMFMDNQCHEPPPYPGSSILSLAGHGIPWPPYQDSYRDFRRRSQNNPFWFTPAQLLTREYERWQEEFRKSAQFPLISSPM